MDPSRKVPEMAQSCPRMAPRAQLRRFRLQNCPAVLPLAIKCLGGPLFGGRILTEIWPGPFQSLFVRGPFLPYFREKSAPQGGPPRQNTQGPNMKIDDFASKGSELPPWSLPGATWPPSARFLKNSHFLVKSRFWSKILHHPNFRLAECRRL